MPTIEFPEPIPMSKLGPQMGLGPEDQLVSQLVVKSMLLDAQGVPRPAVIFTGRTPYGVLPQWLYAGDPDQMCQMRDLVVDRVRHAIEVAEAERSRRG